MKLLCAFRPNDPGVEIRMAEHNDDAENQRPVTGWMYIDLSQQEANRMLDHFDWFTQLRDQRPSLINIGIELRTPEQAVAADAEANRDIPEEVNFCLRDNCPELEDLWRRYRMSEDSRFAELPTNVTPSQLPGDERALSHAQADINIEPKGVFYFIFLPDIQFTVESPIFDRNLLLRAAGLVENASDEAPQQEQDQEQEDADQSSG